MNKAPKTNSLPAALLKWVEEVTGAEVIAARPRAGVGESRAGAEITLKTSSKGRSHCYLSYEHSVQDDPVRQQNFDREVRFLEGLQNTSVRVAPLISFNRNQRAFLTRFVSGSNNIANLADSDREAVCFGYMSQLAELHRLPRKTIDLKESSPQSISAYLVDSIDSLFSLHRAGQVDPLILFVLQWLKDNIPEDNYEPTYVHGDAGAGNFLFENGEVSAMLDWELAHIGDPMEDLAWICFRDLAQRFYSLKECFGAYEKAGGYPVDIKRVKYYRVYIQASIFVGMYHNLFQNNNDFTPVLGNILNFYTLHIRTAMEGIAEIEGLSIERPEPPKRDVPANVRFHDICLADLKEYVVPGATDQAVSVRAKGLARVIKYWQSEKLFGSEFEAQELSDLTNILGSTPLSIEQGRADLCERIEKRFANKEEIIDVLLSRVWRETELMRASMGRLADSQYSPIDGATE